MNNTADLYTELDTNLAVAGVELCVSEAHGTLVGAIANHLKSGIGPDLLKLIEPRADVAEPHFAQLQTNIHAHHRQLSEQFFESSEDFELLLPTDDEALTVRAEALAAWARGYLLGLLYNNAFSIDQLPESGPEIARDIMAIAELSDSDDAGDQEDWALAELQEYVKVGVQLIFESIYSARASDFPPAQQ
jgi:uncharacterized protein YgfB (UPF0149 family)